MQQHAEDSVATIKALFESTCAKAAWHRPSVVVFDDMDKVIGAELEVTGFRTVRIRLVFTLRLVAFRLFPIPSTRSTIPGNNFSLA
jgi:peroxin-1